MGKVARHLNTQQRTEANRRAREREVQMKLDEALGDERERKWEEVRLNNAVHKLARAWGAKVRS